MEEGGRLGGMLLRQCSGGMGMVMVRLGTLEIFGGIECYLLTVASYLAVMGNLAEIVSMSGKITSLPASRNSYFER